MSSMRRVQEAGIIALVACTIVIACYYLYSRHSEPGQGVTRANFSRLEDGMSQSQVEDIFGEQGRRWHPGKSDGGILTAARWEGAGVAYAVFSGEAGLVRKQWHEEGFFTPTKEKFTRIGEGVTRGDVIDLFGRPPDDAEPTCEIWRDIDGEAAVSFNDGRVSKAFWRVWWRDFDSRRKGRTSG